MYIALITIAVILVIGVIYYLVAQRNKPQTIASG